MSDFFFLKKFDRRQRYALTFFVEKVSILFVSSDTPNAKFGLKHCPWSLVLLLLFPSLLLGKFELKEQDEMRYKQPVLQAVESYYYKQLNIQQLKEKSLSEILAVLDEDSSLIGAQAKEIDYVRGFKKRDGMGDIQILENNIGYIPFSYFSTGVTKTFKRALKDHENKKMKRLILDFRDCPGGDFNEAIGLAEVFVPSRQPLAVINTRNSQTVYRSKNERPLRIPLVALINQNTASSAELVAAILKRNGETTIVGLPTQGKDTIQQIFPIFDSWFCLTIGHWRLDQEANQRYCPVLPHYLLNDSRRQLDVAISILTSEKRNDE